MAVALCPLLLAASLPAAAASLPAHGQPWRAAGTPPPPTPAGRVPRTLLVSPHHRHLGFIILATPARGREAKGFAPAGAWGVGLGEVRGPGKQEQGEPEDERTQGHRGGPNQVGPAEPRGTPHAAVQGGGRPNPAQLAASLTGDSVLGPQGPAPRQEAGRGTLRKTLCPVTRRLCRSVACARASPGQASRARPGRPSGSGDVGLASSSFYRHRRGFASTSSGPGDSGMNVAVSA